jgi:chromosome segregation ATPase
MNSNVYSNIVTELCLAHVQSRISFEDLLEALESLHKVRCDKNHIDALEAQAKGALDRFHDLEMKISDLTEQLRLADNRSEYLSREIERLQSLVNNVPPDVLYRLNDVERRLADGGQRIPAIKAFKLRTLVGLVEAKHAVETYMNSPECKWKPSNVKEKFQDLPNPVKSEDWSEDDIPF